MLEAEHARLECLLRGLREACCEFDRLKECQSCDKEQIASCQGRLVSFSHDFLDFVIEHFENEERIMTAILGAEDSDRYFHPHQKAHVRLVREMERPMSELSRMSKQGNTAAAIGELYGLTEEMFSEHARACDDALMQLPQIEHNGDK